MSLAPALTSFSEVVLFGSILASFVDLSLLQLLYHVTLILTLVCHLIFLDVKHLQGTVVEIRDLHGL